MITPMQKLTIVCLDQDRDTALRELQELGVVHLVPVTPPTGDDLEALYDERARIQQVLTALEAAATANKPSKASAPAEAAPELIAALSQVLALRTQLQEERAALTAEQNRLLPYGYFKPEQLKALAEQGILVRLFRDNEKQRIQVPPDALVTVLGDNGTDRYVAVTGQGEVTGYVDELKVPERSLGSLELRLVEIEKELKALEADLHAAVPRLDDLRIQAAENADGVAFVEARSGMGSHSRLAYLQGFCPVRNLPAVQSRAQQGGWAVTAAKADERDKVPTLITSPKWVQPIKAVFEVIKILPGYLEQDISTVFLVFFSLFFAMLIGDAGYGLIFLGLTLFARSRMKSAPAYPFIMLTILSVGTVVWGTLTGNYFGIEASTLLAPLRGCQIPWLQDDSNIMMLCFLIGAVHMTIAHAWRIILLFPHRKVWAQLGWIMVLWAMFFFARMLVVQIPKPAITNALLGIGIVLVALFTCTSRDELKSNWIDLAMLPLSVVSALVDVISYIRLFAVGMASLAVAQSFNQM
ncbi:MAG: hypothetical protein O3A51_06420, partial [Verrucomicrobia bacterium]|nr:hypothetical protein [Verrucomicrobiota bacterium]